MRPFYLTWAYVSANVWVWSVVFHTMVRIFCSPRLPFFLNHPFPSVLYMPFFPFPHGSSFSVHVLSDAQEMCFRLANMHRATNREVGLLFGPTRDPIRAPHDWHAT